MKVVGPCHICQAPALYTCHLCGRLVCARHYNAEKGLCVNCAQNQGGGRSKPPPEKVLS